MVEVFSAGWDRRNVYEDAKHSPAISVEYLEPVDGNFAVTWLEMSRKLPDGMRKLCCFDVLDLILIHFSSRRMSFSMSRTECLCKCHGDV